LAECGETRKTDKEHKEKITDERGEAKHGLVLMMELKISP
jgi:hypothetical protein